MSNALVPSFGRRRPEIPLSQGGTVVARQASEPAAPHPAAGRPSGAGAPLA